MNLQRSAIFGGLLIALGMTSCDQEQVLTPQRRARRLAVAGHELYLKGKYVDALPLYEKAVQLYPEDIVAQRGIVETRFKLRQYDLAVQDANAALGRFPTDWMLLEARADALIALGRKDDAIRDYRRCIEMDPAGYWEPWMKLASAQRAVGADADARATYLDLLSRYPGHKEARSALSELKP